MAGKVAFFIAEGLEEVEALATYDVLFRAHLEPELVSISPSKTVVSSHNVTLGCHSSIYDADFDFGAYELLVLPGGMPGTKNLRASQPLCEALRAQLAAGKRVAAICAAPSILAELGLLEGVKATANPNFQHILEEHGAQVLSSSPVVVDGQITTAQGMGCAVAFGLSLVEQLSDTTTADAVRTGIVNLY